MKTELKKQICVILLILMAVVGLPLGTMANADRAEAVTTANITITVTPGAVALSCNVSSLAFGTVAVSGTSNTSTSYVGITNTSTVEGDFTIAVTANSWTGGATPWTHSDTATADADQCGMNSNRGGTWGTGDVIVKYTSPNYIFENCPSSTNFDFGLSMVMPTSSTVVDQKTNEVQVTVAAS